MGFLNYFGMFLLFLGIIIMLYSLFGEASKKNGQDKNAIYVMVGLTVFLAGFFAQLF